MPIASTESGICIVNFLTYNRWCYLLTLHSNHKFFPLIELLQPVFWRGHIGDDQRLYTSGQKTAQTQQGRRP